MDNELITRMIRNARECAKALRIQDYWRGTNYLKRLLDLLGNKEVFEEAQELLVCVEGIEQALVYEDMLLVADYLEEGFIPELASYLVEDEMVETNNYRVERTSIGAWTVYSKKTNRYLHSNGNPYSEAMDLVNHCYDPNKKIYVVWGCGLGYHILELLSISNMSIDIYVYEEDKELLEVFTKYGVLENVEGSKIHLYHDVDGRLFSQMIQKDSVGILLHYPSIQNITDERLKDTMKSFYSSWNGIYQMKRERQINFRKNKDNCNKNVDELEKVIKGQKVVIVGGGPSVNESIDFLKKNCRDKLILAVNTIVPCLQMHGIVPDYVIIMEADTAIKEDINDAMDVPLIVDSTACWQIAEHSSADKYIVYQEGNDAAESCARKEGHHIYETGGSVVTLAMSVALNLGATDLFFVGVDLANPQGKTHADGTKRQRQTSVYDDKKYTFSVNNELVETDLNLLSYKKWIEQEIKKFPDVNFYNMSKIGAMIEGTSALREDC